MTNNTYKKKANSNNTRIHVKPNVRDLAIFLVILIVFGLIFMNFWFTFLMVAGVLCIIGLSTWINKKRKKKWIRITFNILAILFLLGAIAGIGGVAWFLNYIVKNAPEFDESSLIMSQTSLVYDSNNKLYAELGTNKRENIKYDKMNEVLIDALIATEDSRFFQHNGFDAPRFIIASLKQGLGDSNAGGASTLTMQVAKNVYNADKSTVTKGFAGIARKFTDIYMAVFKIEGNYSKQEIIEFYLNNHFLGNNAYGIEQGSQTYFGKHASELNLSEAALLIGMFQAPTSYNPFKYPEAASDRRDTVLRLMKQHGYITEEERAMASSIPVSSLLTASKTEQEYWAYLNTVVEEAIDEYGVNPHKTSVKIYTNMNPDYQKVIDDVFSGKTYKWENPVVQAGVTVIDVHTGKVLAIGTGRNTDGNLPFNYATGTKRQIGSTAKPLFDYAPGMEFNNWSTYTLFDDSPYYYSTGQPIRNSDRQYMGVITLRTALAESRNVPALKAFQKLDNKKIYNFVTSLGITLEDEAIQTGRLHESYSIGSFNGSNPYQMAAAYAPFANGGYYYKPYTINKIVFRDTDEVITYESEGKRVMSDSTAFMITDVLKTAVNSGLSGAAKINGVNVAAKTGTTNFPASLIKSNGYSNDAVNDAWVIGYDPNTVISIWYGYEPASKKYWTTNTTAYYQRKGLFSAIGGKIFKKNGSDFAVPKSVVKVAVEKSDDINAEPKLASEFTPVDKITYEYFKKGTEPTEVSTAYQRLPDPTNFTGVYNPSSMTINLSWSGVVMPTDPLKNYGNLGYKIYKDGKFVAFTTSTSYTITNVADPNGTYRVSTGYENGSINESLGVTYKLNYESNVKYEIQFKVPTDKTYKVGAVIDSYDSEPSSNDLNLTADGVSVVPDVSIIIKNANGDNVANISTMEAGTYIVQYTVKYKTYNKTVTRTVTVLKDETPEPTPEPKPEEPEQTEEDKTQ